LRGRNGNAEGVEDAGTIGGWNQGGDLIPRKALELSLNQHQLLGPTVNCLVSDMFILPSAEQNRSMEDADEN
jgi:hypothetical protein